MRFIKFDFLDRETLIGGYITNEFYKEFECEFSMDRDESIVIMIDDDNRLMAYAIIYSYVDPCLKLGDFDGYIYVSYVHSFSSGCGKILLDKLGKIVLYSLRNKTSYYEHINYTRIKDSNYFSNVSNVTKIEYIINPYENMDKIKLPRRCNDRNKQGVINNKWYDY